MNRIFFIFWLIAAFLYIYAPLNLFPFNISHVLALCSWLIIIFYYVEIFEKFCKSNMIGAIIILNIFSIILTFFHSIFDWNRSFMIYQHFFILFEVLPISFVLSIIFLKKGGTDGSFLKAIFLLGCFQSVIALCTFLWPELRDLLTSKAIVDLGMEGGQLEVSNFRIYGFARSYLFSMPLFLGVCAMIGLILSSEYKWYIFYSIILLPGILLNARIGLFGFGLGVVLYVISIIRKRKFVHSIIFFCSIVFVSIKLFVFYAEGLFELNPFLGGWLETGFYSIIDSDNSNVVYSEMWFVPDTIYWIFGTGDLPYRSKSGLDSDIGYVQIFHFGGIIYSLFIYLPYIIIFLNLSSLKINTSIINLFQLVILLIVGSNLKGNAFYPSEHVLGFILMVSYFQINVFFNDFLHSDVI